MISKMGFLPIRTANKPLKAQIKLHQKQIGTNSIEVAFKEAPFFHGKQAKLAADS